MHRFCAGSRPVTVPRKTDPFRTSRNRRQDALNKQRGTLPRKRFTEAQIATVAREVDNEAEVAHRIVGQLDE